MNEHEQYLPMVIVIGIIALVIYFAPAHTSRKKVRFWQVFWINLLLGWTLVGRVVALVMALNPDNTALPEEERARYEKKMKKIIAWVIGIVGVIWCIGYFG